MLASSWGHLGLILASSWTHLGVILAHLGLILAHLGSSWAHLGSSWPHLGLILASSWLILGSSWLILASSYFTASWGRLSVPLSQRIAAAAQQDFAAAGVKAPLGVARFASIGATGRLKNNMRKDLFKHKLAPLVMRDALCSIRLWIKSRALRLHLLTLLYSFAWQTNQQILASLMARWLWICVLTLGCASTQKHFSAMMQPMINKWSASSWGAHVQDVQEGQRSVGKHIWFKIINAKWVLCGHWMNGRAQKNTFQQWCSLWLTNGVPLVCGSCLHLERSSATRNVPTSAHISNILAGPQTSGFIISTVTLSCYFAFFYFTYFTSLHLTL